MHRSVHRIARFVMTRGDIRLATPRQRARARSLVIAAAAGAVLVPLFSSSSNAQTWINPNTGLWSDGSNWVGGVAPVSGAATQLQFVATGAESYIASNDIASPFCSTRSRSTIRAAARSS
jgi:hypothetical protein